MFILFVSCEMFVCNIAIMSYLNWTEHRHKAGETILSFWETRTVMVSGEDQWSVFHVHETAFRNVPYLLV